MAEARRQREWERKLKDDGTMKPRVEGIISNFISTCGGVGAVLRYGKRKLARLIHFTGHARSDVKAVLIFRYKMRRWRPVQRAQLRRC